jgi:hypothetical protein
MGEGYNVQNEGPSDQSMDEFLCEYVDGTMDHRVRVVFEEYLAVDPLLAAHVRRLQETRALLCSYRCSLHAPGNFNRRLYREMTSEWMSSMRPPDSEAPDRLRHVAGLTSVAVALALFSMMVIAERDVESASSRFVTAEVERPLDFPFRTSFDDGAIVGVEQSALDLGTSIPPRGRSNMLPLFDIHAAGFAVHP